MTKPDLKGPKHSNHYTECRRAMSTKIAAPASGVGMEGRAMQRLKAIELCLGTAHQRVQAVARPAKIEPNVLGMIGVRLKHCD